MTNQLSFDPKVFGPSVDALKVFFNGLENVPSAFAPMKVAVRLQLEATGFISRRAQACLEIPARLGQCRTPQDLVTEQMRFWRTAYEQYVESAQRMGQIWSSAASFPFGGTDQPSRPERDYITFPEPQEASTQREQSGSARGQRRRVA
jgi:hypothetical protein